MLAAFFSCCCKSPCSTAPEYTNSTLPNIFIASDYSYQNFFIPDFVIPSPDSFSIKLLPSSSLFSYRPFEFSYILDQFLDCEFDVYRNPGTGSQTSTPFGWAESSIFIPTTTGGKTPDSFVRCVDTNQKNSVLLVSALKRGDCTSYFRASILPPVFKLNDLLFRIPYVEHRFAYLKKTTFSKSDFTSANYSAMVSQFNNFIKVS